METVKHGGELVHFKEVLPWSDEGICPLCDSLVKIGQEAYLVSTSGTPKPLFPNIHVHKKCVSPKAPFNTNNPFVWAAGELSKSYRESRKYRGWYVN